MRTASIFAMFAIFLSGCATTRTLPVTEVDEQAVARMRPMLVQAQVTQELDVQTKALLTYLASANIADLVQTPAHAQGQWTIDRIVIVNPGSEVSVVCYEGHWDEVIHFSLGDEDDVWIITGRRRSDRTPKGVPVVRWKAPRLPGVYVVEPRDSLFRVCLKCGVTISDLKRINGLTNDTVTVGQKLVIPPTAK